MLISEKSLFKKFKKVIPFLWFIVPLVGIIPKIIMGPRAYNNYLIYKYTFWHSWNEQNLYSLYPNQYFDQNHYGPTFSALMAPFAILPDSLGIILWTVASISILFYAINKLPLQYESKLVVLAICLIELVGTVQNQQFNTILCASILLSFTYLYHSKIPAAAFMIAGGFLIKLYGLVGLAFTIFSGKYKKMAIWMTVAILLLVALPMIWSSPSYIINSYVDWYKSLEAKNLENIQNNIRAGMQDISFMGLVKRTTGFYSLSNLWFHIPAAVLLIIPLLKRKFHQNLEFQLSYLAQVMIGLVIFSTSAESPTYIIAVCGFAIWYAQWKDTKPNWLHALFVLVFLITILSGSDLYSKTFRREVIVRYALKAFPCVVAWLCISWRLLFFNPSKSI